jgi:putative tryptophan/tyrosine transport system substrate-binding protein
VKRRTFILALGSAAAWPLAARAQQPAMPVIGFLHSASADTFADRLRAFRQGMKETGHVEGENVHIEYRWAENQLDRLPALADELVRRQVAVIAAPNTASALAAKAATTTIPIVFISPEDPVGLGFVASLARPGGNLTGIIALLVEPANVRITEGAVRDVEAAARAMGLQIRVLNANTSREIDTAFATLLARADEVIE